MNDLLERYVVEVERRLPRGERGDVGRELRSLLAESIDARVEAGRDEESATVAVLEEFGPPIAAAARYRTGRTLWIGPELMPAFTRTVAGALLVLAALAGLGLLWHVRGAADFQRALVDGIVLAVVGFIDNVVKVLGVVVIVFLAVEWLGGGSGADRGRRRWDPRTLPPLDDEQRVRRGPLAVGMAVLVVLIAWIALWREDFGVLGRVDGEWSVLLHPGEGFWALAPWLATVWCVELALDGIVLARGRWTRGLRAAELAVKLGGLVVLGLLFLSPDLIALEPVAAADVSPSDHLERLAPLVPRLEGLLRFGLACGWIAGLVGVAKGLIRFLGGE